MVQIYHGDIIYGNANKQLEVYENSYLVVEDGFVKEVTAELRADYDGLAVTDYGRGLIIPAFSDMHVHASQYVQRGIGTDKLLFDWLNDYTFPQESRFASVEYGKDIYDRVIRDFIKYGTFHSAIFTTIHYDSTDYLFNKMSEKGLYSYIGKVNMDQNSPDYYCETTEESLETTERFLDNHRYSKTVKPIIVPRFAPTCSEKLMKGLGTLAKKYGVGVHTHLVESIAEKAWSLELYPDYESDASIYERNGLMDNGPSIFAHVIFPGDDDKRILKKYNSLAVHCPEATTNVIAGIMPAAKLLDEGINIAVGTDVGASGSLEVYKQIAMAVKLSKQKEFYEGEDGNKALNFETAFWMATYQGASLFDRCGSLAEGYRFNGLVIDGLEDGSIQLSPLERLEKFCYCGDDRNIVARYLDGKYIEVE